MPTMDHIASGAPVQRRRAPAPPPPTPPPPAPGSDFGSLNPPPLATATHSSGFPSITLPEHREWRRSVAAAAVGLEGTSTGLVDVDELDQLLASMESGEPDAPPIPSDPRLLLPPPPLPINRTKTPLVAAATNSTNPTNQSNPTVGACPPLPSLRKTAGSSFQIFSASIAPFDASNVAVGSAGDASSALFRNGYQASVECRPGIINICDLGLSFCFECSQYAKVVRARLLHYSVCSLVGQCSN